jgi:hypothetical protein
MALPLPRYIQAANVQNNLLRYTWDDWKLKEIYGDLSDEELYAELETLSYRASVALTIACAEWVIHRFDAVSNDPVPHEYIEAAWAATIDENYLSQWQPPDEDWMGPIRGPLSVALLIIREAIGTAVHEHEQAIPILYIGNLAEHVLTYPDPFLTWRAEVLKRLTLLYPLNPEETLGDVVPREALDPAFAFQPESTELLIRDFMARLDYQANPFLVTPEEMLELGFDGTPYRFDLTEDRRNRVEW